MKAVVCKELGPVEKLVLEQDWQQPTAKPGEVIVEVKAASLNFPDTLIIEGKYQVQPPLPFVVGGEAAGVISELGEGVSHLNVGDEVIFIGSHGAFSEYVAVKASHVIPKPANTSFEQAAGVGMTYFTSHHALRQRANLQQGETVLVLGAAGGVGLTAVELAKQIGATVIAAASTQEKLDLAVSRGADFTINYSEQNLREQLKEITQGKGVDVVYDPVGGELAEQAFRSIAWNGRYLVIGFAAGDIPKLPLNLPLLKGASIVGVFWGAFTMQQPKVHRQNIEELWTWFAQQKLTPTVTDVFELADFEKAFKHLAERRAKGKVVLKVSV